MKKKILFVVDERMMGGVSVVLNDLVHLLDLSLFDIDILALHNHGDMLNDLPSGVNLIFGSSYFMGVDYTLKQALSSGNMRILCAKLRIVFGLKTGRIRRQITKERRQCIKERYDAEIAFKDGFTALFTAYGETQKKIHWLHCAYKTFNPNEKYPELFQDVLPKFQNIIGVTPAVVREFNALYHLENKTEPIPIAMDIERIKEKAKASAQVCLSKNKLQIAVIGRAHPVKGYDRMIKVISRLHEESIMNEIEIHVFGDGPLFDELKKQISTSQLESVVLLEGQVDNPYAELKEFDLLLLPSYSEAFGTVISEAFILGVPVLSTKTSASELSIKPDYNGWECENSEAGLYACLKHVVSNRDEIIQRKENLKDFTYDNEQILNRITSILLES